MKKVFLLLFLMCASVLYGDETNVADTLKHSDITEIAQPDSASVLNEKIAPRDTLLSMEAQELQSHTKLAIVRREHDYKRQTWLAVGMMAFIAIILSSSQTWNPR